MRVVTNDRARCALLRIAWRTLRLQHCASFDPAPCIARCHADDMEIALHSHARCSPTQTFKTHE